MQWLCSSGLNNREGDRSEWQHSHQGVGALHCFLLRFEVSSAIAGHTVVLASAEYLWTFVVFMPADAVYAAL
jgi:hypothetical protein